MRKRTEIVKQIEKHIRALRDGYEEHTEEHRDCVRILELIGQEFKTPESEIDPEFRKLLDKVTSD